MAKKGKYGIEFRPKFIFEGPVPIADVIEQPDGSVNLKIEQPPHPPYTIHFNSYLELCAWAESLSVEIFDVVDQMQTEDEEMEGITYQEPATSRTEETGHVVTRNEIENLWKKLLR